MEALPRIYLDANAIIRFIESKEDQITALVLQAAAGKTHLFTSELTLAEVLVIPLREGDGRLAEGYEELLQSDDTLTVVPIDRPILRRSAELRARLGGKGHDAIHCATAEISGCGVIISSDRRLRLPEGLRRVAVEDADEVLGE